MQGRRLSATARTCPGWAVLAILLTTLAGCATGGKAKPQPVETAAAAASPTAAASEPAAPAGPSVTRLADGREGFVITENTSLDTESRRDFDRAVALMKNGDDAEAIPLLEKVVERSPGVTAPYVNLAIAYWHVGKPEPAEQHLKAALGLVPGHPVASNEYGLLLRRSGRFAEARSIYEGALATFPEYLPARRNLGILCDLYLGDLGCALEQYEIYSRGMPDDAQVKIWIADLRARLGR